MAKNPHAVALGKRGGSVTSDRKAQSSRENGKKGGRPRDELNWSRWYREARHEMAFRHGMRGIPVDTYKTQWALGDSVQQACRTIAEFRWSYK